jgi:hypothetical protein
MISGSFLLFIIYYLLPHESFEEIMKEPTKQLNNGKMTMIDKLVSCQFDIVV